MSTKFHIPFDSFDGVSGLLGQFLLTDIDDGILDYYFPDFDPKGKVVLKSNVNPEENTCGIDIIILDIDDAIMFKMFYGGMVECP